MNGYKYEMMAVFKQGLDSLVSDPAIACPFLMVAISRRNGQMFYLYA